MLKWVEAKWTTEKVLGAVTELWVVSQRNMLGEKEIRVWPHKAILSKA